LDYLSDFVCCLYGKPGAYGVVTMPFSVREGINVFLAGYIPTENLRFRPVELTFKVAESVTSTGNRQQDTYKYPEMSKSFGDFHLDIDAGGFSESQIVVMLGQNGTGKTTFIRMLAGLEKPDDSKTELPKLSISYKPQKLSPKFEGTVKELFHDKIRAMYVHPQFVADVMKPLNMDDLIDNEVKHLSGGELQRVAIVLALGRPAGQCCFGFSPLCFFLFCFLCHL
jgi:ATP-binding cassette subfamily E protein 1